MGHEITSTDNVVLHKDAAWHGLGVIVQDAPTPREALKIAGLDWTVQQAPLAAKLADGNELAVPTHKLNFRGDNNGFLGVVGKDYRPIQNSELADFCEALAEQGDEVKIESAGSIRGGQKVWFLLKGESFSVRDKDEVQPYICVSNGHDGWTALRCTPTTVRVVCSNTLHAVVGSSEPGRPFRQAQQATFVAHHTATIMDRVEEAKAALKLYNRAVNDTRMIIDQLAAKDVSRADVQRFFLECYTKDFGPFADNPQTKVEQNTRNRAMDACAAVFSRFDQELSICGPTAWNALNSYTQWSQHRISRLKDTNKAHERSVESKLFGAEAQRAHRALLTALAL